jgi:ADP-dependent NAD(P)H-hydrate dehydratase / NAD(P)H-hydrate epimerase
VASYCHMQKVLTAAEMREIDRQTTERYGMPPLLLMENAAHAAARVIAEKLGGTVADRSVLIFCGKGNNGGDGAALARVLWQQGADVEVCLLGLVADTKDEARVNFEILQRISAKEDFELEQPDLAFEEIVSLEEWLDYDSQNFHCDDPDVIVDALFGTGLERPLDGVFEQVAAYIAAYCADECDSNTLVVSLDLPSGLNADRGLPIGAYCRAHLTVSYTAPKLANVLPPVSDDNGELRIERIGSPCDLISAAASQTFLAEASDAALWLARSEYTNDSYKNRRGHALVVAGSKNYAGAAALCGNAVICSGAGVSTIATPESAVLSVSSRSLPEVMVRGLSETSRGAVSEDAFPQIQEFWHNVDCVAIGSGLSSGDETIEKLVRRVIEKRRTPLLIDADGLNAIAPFSLEGSDELPLVLTPHEKEFLRLLGAEDSGALSDRVSVAREFASRHHVFLILKGPRNLVAAPDGRVVINPTGNSGVGKAGNGDTFAGILGGFIAQAVRLELDIFDTLVAATYIAGMAADIAEAKFGKRVMLATDVRECMQEAFEQLEC